MAARARRADGNPGFVSNPPADPTAATLAAGKALGVNRPRRQMFFHHKELAYTVRVDKPNPVFARMLQ